MKKIISILLISFLLIFFIAREKQTDYLFAADTTITIMELQELETMDTNDYLIVVDTSANITKRISANGAVVVFLKGKTVDSLNIVELVIDTLSGWATSPITVLDTLNVTGQVNATYLKGDSTYTPIIVIDTIKSNAKITGHLDIPTDSLKINGINITKTATEINNTVDSISVLSARSLSNKDTIDTYIDGITYSKDLYNTGVTANEFDVLDGITAKTGELNILDGTTAVTADLDKMHNVTSTADELNKLDGTTAITTDFDKLHNITATASEINKCDGISATAYQTVMEMVTFKESNGAGTYTGTITVPAHSIVLDVVWKNVKLWTASTSATLNVGDADDTDGYFASVDLKTEPAEATSTSPVSWSSFQSDAGGKAGAYAGLQKYSTSAQTITATVVTVGSTGEVGESYLFVIYSTPTAVEATKE